MTSYIAKCGIYGTTAKVWVDKRLDRMPYAQAGIIRNDYGTHLMSYNTCVCSIDREGWLTCTGTYSQSTRKHIGAFMHECADGLSYYDAKRCYENGEALNIYTGEVRDLREMAATA